MVLKRKKYCCIQKCKHFTGTSDENTHFFSVPIYPDIRKKWLTAIETANGKIWNGIGKVCDLHFDKKDIRPNGFKKVVLINGSFPRFLPNDSHSDSNSNCDLNANSDVQSQNDPNEEACKLRVLLKNTQAVLEAGRLNYSEQIKKLQAEKNQLSDELSKKNMELAFLQRTLEDIKEIYEIDTRKEQHEIISCFVNGVKSNQKYPPTVRSFCLGLHYHSPRAYEFVRNSFNKNLPHVSTLRQWYVNSSLLDEPGINSTVLNKLKNLATEKKKNGQELLISLSCDEMHIRKHVQWINSTKKLLGYATVGNETEKSNVAKQALVFMVYTINEDINLPLAHYFISSLDAQGRKDLYVSVLYALSECGVIVTNITFDGLPANGKMCKLLNADMNINSVNFAPSISFDHMEPIHVIYDHCHMLKLIRNALGSKKTLYNSSGAKIEWVYFENLIEKSDFKGMHKLTKAHIQWKRKIMKVLIAVQTLSESTANALEYLKNAGHDEFKEATPTIEFIRVFNKLFDIFNTKSSVNQNQFKNALDLNNIHEVSKFFGEAEKYILSLKVKNDKDQLVKVVNSKIRTGFIGFIINMRSLRNIFDQFVVHKKLLQNIRTYHLCQDPLEIFFGKVRSLNGYNDNPTMQQFSAAYRKLLVHSGIQSSRSSNCVSSKIKIDIMHELKTVSSRRSVQPTQNRNLPETEISDVELNILQEELPTISASIMAHAIENKMKSSSLYCKDCANLFEENEKTEIEYNVKTCKSTFDICSIVEKYMILKNLLSVSDFKIIYSKIFEDIDIEKMFVTTDFSHDADHKLYVIRFIIDAAIHIKGTMIAKEATFSEHKQLLRSKFKHLIHYYGQ